MIRIVYQNNNFAVCNKLPMTLSVPAREKNDPRPCLGLELQKHLNTQVFPVHRLDYEVSGLILFALNSKAHRASQEWFLKRSIRKLYSAQTQLQDFSHWPANVDTDRTNIEAAIDQKFFWRTRMLRGKKRTFESAQGDWAETEATIKDIDSGLVTWQLYPITGKPHQLRFELSRHGFPILGDLLYGSRFERSEAGIALQAYELDLSRVSDRFGLPEKISISNS